MILSLIAVVSSFGCNSTDTIVEPPLAVKKRVTFVVAELPDYQWQSAPPETVPWEHIDVLNIGMLWPREVGNSYSLGQSNWDTLIADPISVEWFAQAQAYAHAAHAHGSRVAMLLGGQWGDPNPTGIEGQDYFTLATDTDEHATQFARNIKDVLQSMDMDGVNLDWETGASSDAVRYAGLVRLAHALRVVWPEVLLTMATDAFGSDASALAAAQIDVDMFEPMTYLDIPQWGGWVLPIPLSPLYATLNNSYSIDETLQQWLDAGVASNKIMLGTAGFGSVWGDTNGDYAAPNSPLVAGIEAPYGEYSSICSDNCVNLTWLSEVLTDHPELTEYWHETTMTSYWSAPSPTDLVTVPHPRYADQTIDVGVIFYETPKSIAAKADYVNMHQMKGISFWTLAQMMNGTRAPLLEAVP